MESSKSLIARIGKTSRSCFRSHHAWYALEHILPWLALHPKFPHMIPHQPTILPLHMRHIVFPFSHARRLSNLEGGITSTGLIKAMISGSDIFLSYIDDTALKENTDFATLPNDFNQYLLINKGQTKICDELG